MHFFEVYNESGYCGAVGMAIDTAGRRLIYTNIGEVKIEDNVYSWHKVESVDIDGYPSGSKVRTLISSIADKPRAVVIDAAKA